MMVTKIDPKNNQVVDPNWNAGNAAYAPYMQNPYNLAPDEPVAPPQPQTSTLTPQMKEALMQDMRDAIAREIQSRMQQATVQPSSHPSQAPTQSTSPTLTDPSIIQDALIAALGASAAANKGTSTPRNLSELPEDVRAMLPSTNTPPALPPPQRALPSPTPIRMPDETSGATINMPPAFDKATAKPINLRGQTFYIQDGKSVFDNAGRYMGEASKIVPRNTQGVLRTLGLLSRTVR